MIFKKHSIIFAISILNLFIFSIILQGQGVVKIKVTDNDSKESLPGVIIKVDSTYYVADSLGEATIQLSTQLSTLTLNMVGYEEKVMKIDGLKNGGKIIFIQLIPSNYLLNTAIVSASRFEQPISESPISIEVLKPLDVLRINATSVSDIVDKVSGVQILDGQANIRGGSGYSYGAGSRVLLVMDDLPILQPDAGFPYWDDLPLENIDQVEVLKGASSALYGSSAMNGVIHFRSAKPTLEGKTDISFVTKLTLKPALHNEWWEKGDHKNVIPSEININVSHRKKINAIDYSLGTNYARKIGYNLGHNSDNVRMNAFIRKRIHDRLNFSVQANLNSGSSSSFFYWNAFASFAADSASVSSSKKLRFTIDPSVTYFSKTGYRHKLLTRWYHVNNENDNDQSNQSENFYAEYQLQKEHIPLGLTWTIGAVLFQNYVQAKLYSDTTFTSQNRSLYAQVEKKFWKKLILSAGFRYEYFEIQGPSTLDGKPVDAKSKEDKPVFRFGLNYQINKGLFLRSSWGQGFRFPTLAEKYISTKAGGLTITSNPNLRSEYGQSAEIGLKQGFLLNNWSGVFDASAFWSQYRDMMEFTLIFRDFKFLFQSQNIGDTEIKGIELIHQSKLNFDNFDLQFGAGFTLIDPKFLEWDITGKDLAINNREKGTRGQQNAAGSTAIENVLKYRSKHIAKLDVQFDYKKFYLGGNFEYASQVQAIDWLFEVDIFIKGIKEFRHVYNHGYRLYDFRVGYQQTKWDLQLILQNAFNEVYTKRPGLMEAPRSLNCRFTYHL
ncbi:MAG: TonB-dependent receptor [Bacteroidota bacterium]|nr:TonB-dependent receptor [Bacteroidota bacterium]